jgi:hypothetical protein
VRAALAQALQDAAALLGGTVEAYVDVPEAEDLDGGGGGGASPRARKSHARLGLERVAAGFTGVAAPDGGDAGLALAHAALHALEARLSRQLERLATLLSHAAEERRVRLGDAVSVRRFGAAAAATRAVFTGAVALLHGMESGLHLCALCVVHAPAIRSARAELGAAFAAAGRLATRDGSAAEASAALARLEQAVEALAADVTAEAAWRRLLTAVEPDGDAGAGGAGGHRGLPHSTSDVTLRHNLQALGAVCFALGDAARQLRRIVAEVSESEALAAAGGSHHAHKRSRSADDLAAGVVGAVGGAAPAAGGGGMGSALRGAAHALDVALHWHLAQKHGGGKEGDGAAAAQRSTGTVPRSRTLAALWHREPSGGAPRTGSVRNGSAFHESGS